MYNKNYNDDNGLVNRNSQGEFNNIIVTVGGICSETLKFHLKKDGYVKLCDGLELHTVADDDSILRVTYPNGNWLNIVKNHSVGSRCNWKYVTDQVKHIVCGHYNVPEPKYFPTFNDWAEDLYEYGYCSSEKRWERFQSKALESAAKVFNY